MHFTHHSAETPCRYALSYRAPNGDVFYLGLDDTLVMRREDARLMPAEALAYTERRTERLLPDFKHWEVAGPFCDMGIESAYCDPDTKYEHTDSDDCGCDDCRHENGG